MTWFKVDDGFHAHPKLIALEAGPCCYEAVSLWVLAGSWSAGQLTNGEIPAALPRKFGFKTRAEKELVRVGLWTKTDDGFRFHDWDKYQPTKDEIETRRAATKDRVKRHRSARGNGVTDSAGNASQAGPSNGVSSASPVPSRPKDPPKPPEGAGAVRCATQPAEGAPTADLVADAVRAVARARAVAPTPFVSRAELAAAAERVDEAVRDGVAPDAGTAATALVEAAFALGDGTQQRPLRFALLEACIAPNGRAAAQARHVPPEDPWV